MNVVEEYKLDVIKNFDNDLYELYLTVENQCQEEIELPDVVRIVNHCYETIISQDVSKVANKKLQRENIILKDILIEKEIQLYTESNKDKGEL